MAITISGSGITSANIADGTIVNADINSSAAIAGTKVSGSFGKVLQVVSATKTDQQTTTSQSMVDITGLSVSITPASTSSKILIIASVNGHNNTQGGAIQLVRDSTAIALGTGATGNRVAVTAANFYDGDMNTPQQLAVNYLDEPTIPGTPVAITYKVQTRVGGAGGGTVAINRSFNNLDQAYTFYSSSTITVMEIGA